MAAREELGLTADLECDIWPEIDTGTVAERLHEVSEKRFAFAALGIVLSTVVKKAADLGPPRTKEAGKSLAAIGFIASAIAAHSAVRYRQQADALAEYVEKRQQQS